MIIKRSQVLALPLLHGLARLASFQWHQPSQDSDFMFIFPIFQIQSHMDHISQWSATSLIFSLRRANYVWYVTAPAVAWPQRSPIFQSFLLCLHFLNLKTTPTTTSYTCSPSLKSFLSAPFTDGFCSEPLARRCTHRKRLTHFVTVQRFFPRSAAK